MKIFATRVIPEPGRLLLESAGIQLNVWTEKRDLTQKELIEHCNGMDGLLSVGPNRIDKPFLAACGHLRVISLLSVGYDHVDVAECARLNIPVSNTPGVLSGATADTAFLLMLATSRKAFFMHRKIVNAEWGFFEPTADLGIELNGKTLGIFGLGNIGFEMGRRARGAYGMNIIYHNRHRSERAENELGAMLVSFDELLSQSDVLSVHCSLTPETKGMFTLQRFQQMKRSAIFINTARGSIHVEKDLATAITERTIWGAGLDVTDPEPMLPGNPLLFLPNICILPHIGSATEETRNAMSVMAATNIIAALKGEAMPNPVKPRDV